MNERKNPLAVSFIVAMEACERFSFYGLVSILTLYLKNELRLGEGHSKEVVHLFKTGAYFLPLLGGFIADRWLGRYRTILSLSLVYLFYRLVLRRLTFYHWNRVYLLCYTLLSFLFLL